MADLYVENGYVDAGYVEETTVAIGYPAPSEVKSGVIYGPNLEYVGTFTGDSAEAIATEVVRQINQAIIPVNVVEINSILVGGSGVEGDTWGPA